MTTPAPTDKTSYREVMAEILARITNGPWGPGTLLPNEVELAEEFSVSRTTMNRALREVSDMGFLDRKRKAGTRVRMAPIRQARFEMPVIRSEIETTGADYSYRLVSQDTIAAPDWLRARMKLGPRAKVVHVICLHFASGEVFQLENRYINVQALPQASAQDFAKVTPNEWLLATVPFSEVEISFLATAADDLCVRHLDHSAGDPVFCIQRATWWQNAAITFVSLSHRRDYRMTTRY